MTTNTVALSKVSMRFQNLLALQEVSLEIGSGEVLGLFGHNGAGKTTMMKLILGIHTPTSGSVKVMGISPDSKEAWHMRSSVGYLPENVSFYEQLTGFEVLHYFAKLKGKTKTHVKQLLEQVGIEYAQNRAVKTYSKGMRQRLGLAQAFIGTPKLLLLDEPTVGLDPIATAEFYHTVDQLKTQGTSVILCSHVLPGVEQHIDRGLILNSGSIIAEGTLVELRNIASLPVTVKVENNTSLFSQDSLLSPFIHDEHTLLIPENDKVSLLRHLLSYHQLTDINVESASLDKIYHHFLNTKGQHTNTPQGNTHD